LSTESYNPKCQLIIDSSSLRFSRDPIAGSAVVNAGRQNQVEAKSKLKQKAPIAARHGVARLL